MTRETKNEQLRQRRAERVALGLCRQCKNPALPGKRMCEAHRVAQTQANLKYHGYDVPLQDCARCGKPKVKRVPVCGTCVMQMVEHERWRVRNEDPALLEKLRRVLNRQVESLDVPRDVRFLDVAEVQAQAYYDGLRGQARDAILPDEEAWEFDDLAPEQELPRTQRSL